MGYSLTFQEVESLKTKRATGKTYFELAKEFKITFQHAQAVCSGKQRSQEISKDLPNEKWRIVPSIPVLEASSLGRVRRIETGRVLLGSESKKTDYCQIGLSYNSKKIGPLVHRLITEAWLGACPKGMQVNHINGKKNDNRLENLEYMTPSQNKKHAFRIGLESAVGENNGRAKLTEHEVLEIRGLAKSGMDYKNIASLFSISFQHTHSIIHRKFWKHI